MDLWCNIEKQPSVIFCHRQYTQRRDLKWPHDFQSERRYYPTSQRDFQRSKYPSAPILSWLSFNITINNINDCRKALFKNPSVHSVPLLHVFFSVFNGPALSAITHTYMLTFSLERQKTLYVNLAEMLPQCAMCNKTSQQGSILFYWLLNFIMFLYLKQIGYMDDTNATTKNSSIKCVNESVKDVDCTKHQIIIYPDMFSNIV